MPSGLSNRTADLERRLSVLEARVGLSHRISSVAPSNGSNASIDSVDDRLAKIRVDLESKIASSSGEGAPSTISSNANISQNEKSWKEIQKLLRELDPGIALTHQQQPLLYKRQQILASSDELFKDFAELDLILKLLLTGTKTNGKDTESSSAAASIASGTGAGKAKRGGVSSSTGVADASIASKAGQTSSSAIEIQKQQQAKKELELQQQNQDGVQSRGGQTSIRLDQVTQAPILTQHMASTATRPEDQKRMEDLRLKFMDLHNRTTVLAQTLRHHLECYHTVTTAVSEKIVLADERISMVAAAKKAAA
mmetsp:Transcript_15062/g.41891  ORF Transcript_15062/g.41891 Transcript_15062/m.41891 type:complete len:310 (+) Transcript_15062:227-1156(+)|eukprot:CAMPEP_0172367256 /NCGR_PEP_ID=MMETSP1060-20121228/19966_1 /TAXON_ID=37318 /ORGANISM="Pseudo-nitzschia pungens, Strain cf. cingulata" /LENGTH=309 /DNA_ID=CAMNT_0013091437 /DNA_START=154 /DNA_END=1083 /DNA_ORIENTATION=+